MSTSVIEVRIWGRTAGAVALDPATQCYAFEYDPGWRRSKIELAPLMMPLSSRQPIFVFPALGESFRRLPGLISDALPDDFGNTLIDAWMAEHGVSRAEITPLDRLAYTGRRSIGALEFRPTLGAQRESAHPLAMQSLVETARDVVHGRLRGDQPAATALANLIKVGTSAGGVRAKAVVAWNPQTQEIRGGQFNVAPGFQHWLLKFDGIGRDRDLGTPGGYGQIEYAYHLMARAAGIEMTECRLHHENGRAHFMTRRFDRAGNAKHHVQSLCALLHLDYQQRATHAYEQLFIALRDLGLGRAAAEQAFRRMAFNVMGNNRDAHTKNFAFLLREGSDWELSPAYDVTHAHDPKSIWTAHHLLSVNGKFDGIGRADLLEVADRFTVPNAKDALSDVEGALARWREFAAAAGLPEDRTNEIAADFELVTKP
ncbi:MAG TPA: type II toxin-antitoxin system HipA family toxin [Opitutaceae bacterium]|jgi:serine/threonine-protein kinase HipA|nr:type II toxin-antitoxin system HipA family toxin [Opitutaceae bacterium]